MRRSVGALALAGALASCSGEQPQAERQASDGGFLVALQSEDAIDGRRPILTLSCGPRRASFWLELVRVPDAPSDTAFGIFKIDDGTPIRLPLTWLGADKWALGVDADQEARLVTSMVSGRNIYFTGPEGTTERVYRWDLARLESQLAEVREGCSLQTQSPRSS